MKTCRDERVVERKMIGWRAMKPVRVNLQKEAVLNHHCRKQRVQLRELKAWKTSSRRSCQQHKKWKLQGASIRMVTATDDGTRKDDDNTMRVVSLRVRLQHMRSGVKYAERSMRTWYHAHWQMTQNNLDWKRKESS